MNDADDAELRGLYARLSKADRRWMPAFPGVWAAARRRAPEGSAPGRAWLGRRGALVAVAAVGALIAVAALCARPRGPATGREAFERSLDALAAAVEETFLTERLGDWRSPTDFLLAGASCWDAAGPAAQNGQTP